MKRLMKLTGAQVEDILSEQNIESAKNGIVKDYFKKYKNDEMFKEMLSGLVFVLNIADEYTNIDKELILKDILTIYVSDLTEAERLEKVMSIVISMEEGNYRNNK